MPETIEQQLVKHLTDVHAIEEQALTQLRRAPDVAGDPVLAEVFRRHLGETEDQERRVRERLEAHDAEPAKLKDLAGKAGGVPMVLFARSQPDTPGKLTTHAYSYEHLEEAAYELLARVSDRAGDGETTAVAREIADEERTMSRRLADSFDIAAHASVTAHSPEELSEELNDYLSDAHAIEQQAIQLLAAAKPVAGSEALATLFAEHLDETRAHSERVEQRLEARGASTSAVKDVLLRLGGLNVGAFFAGQPDTPAKLTGFAFAFEHLEIAAYELLRRIAERAEDAETVALAESILAEERAAAEKLAAQWDVAVDAALEAQGVSPA